MDSKVMQKLRGLDEGIVGVNPVLVQINEYWQKIIELQDGVHSLVYLHDKHPVLAALQPWH
jgi:hypothetical protein